MTLLKRLFPKFFLSSGQKCFGPGRMVPEADYNLLRIIRITMAEHGTFTVDGTNLQGDEQGRADRCNARVLHEYYDMSQHEVLVATGVWLEDAKDEGTSNKLRRKCRT